MKLCEATKCTGCGSCSNACPKQCITMVENSIGFKYPSIDIEKCVNCGICTNSCPKLNPIDFSKPNALYSLTYVEDNVTLKKSSSGGASYALGKIIIQQGGVVFGAVYNQNMKVEHIEIKSIEDLSKSQGSKYVQSDLGDCFKKIRKYLSENKKVLFIGTPCQVAGVLKYNEKVDTSNLFTCDLFCGGVPSPKVFNKYVNYLNEKYNISIVDMNFRSKRYGYGYGYLISSIDSNKKQKILSQKDSSYMKCVGAGYVRESCFKCEYSNPNRISDLTIGDYWHLKANYEQWHKGISLVLCNSEKGKTLLNDIRRISKIEEIDIKSLNKSQGVSINGSKKRPNDYDSFFEDSNTMTWKDLHKKYFIPKRFMDRIKECVPVSLLARARNLRRKIK